MAGASAEGFRKPPGNLRQRSASITIYVAIAAGAFLAALAVLLLMVYQAEKLVRLGLVGNLYYVLLVPLGLAVAAFLFGVLRSYAAYTGKIEGGSLELGGPIVGFFLVVVLGFYLIPNPQSFALTVFVHGEEGRQNLILRNTGSVLLDLGGDRRRESIGDKGQAYFAGIPPTFRGQSVSVAVEAQGYEPVTPNGTIKIEGDNAYVAIRPKAAELTGYVRTGAGQPISGATVSVAGISTQTDASGFFKLRLPGAGTHQNLTMQVAAPGFSAWNSQVVPGANEITVVLDSTAK
jgi:carboxypeptidase family protein